MVRSGTSVSLNYGEAQGGESRKDFIHKMKVVLKELRETFICLKMIHNTKLFKTESKIIRAKKERVNHKLKKELLDEYGGSIPESLYCYWSGINPLKTKEGDKVMFTDGTNVYAEGKILGVDTFDGLMFEPLKEVNYSQPKKAPTRGFTYII